MINLLLAIPATFGAILLVAALIFQLIFAFYQIDTGPVAQLQQYSVWSAFIAVIGHIVNAYKHVNRIVFPCV
jgi:hypothetical protein